MSLVGLLALALLAVQAIRLSARLARRVGVASFPAVLAAVLGLAAVGLSEGLSLVHGLGRAGVALAAGAALLASAALGLPRVSPRGLGEAVRRAVEAGGSEGRLAACLLALLAGVTLFLALASPPNTDDALVYHLPPVRHWLEQGSVAHYPTPIDRQLRSPPLAAYLRLPLEALTGSDALFGLVQWIFYVLATAQAAGLAWLAAGDARVAWRAAVIAGTLPMAVLQASSTQNDLVVSGYVLGAVAAMAGMARGGMGMGPAWLAGACLGLAASTKGTGLLLALLLLPPLVAIARRRAAAAVALAALLAAPSLIRNARTFGSALPHPEVVPAGAWLDAGAPARAAGQVAGGVLVQMQPLLARSRWMSRLAPAERDPQTAWTGDVELLRRTSPRHEDTAGNPLHFLLAVWAAGVALVRRRPRDRAAIAQEGPSLMWLALLGVAAWLALTVPVRFSPWLGRLQLPALVLMAAPIALALGRASGTPEVNSGVPLLARSRRDRGEGRALAVCALIAVGSLPPLLANAMKPLVPWGSEAPLFALSRWENRFRSRPELRPAVEAVLGGLPAGCASVGLRVRGHQAEYALWAGARGRRFVHLMPHARQPRVCAVISDRCTGGGALCREEP
jgi:hypothetical protein